MKINHFGILYIVATPIGNLEDITFRAVRVLKEVDLIAAEDTRHSRSLLQQFGISTPLLALHEHNEQGILQKLITKLQAGESIALISDAGTPLLSDPGYAFVKAAHFAGITVSPVPGASALIAALSVAGLPTDRFCFEGFLSAKKSERKQQLEALRQETRTLVFYEAPHRIIDTIEEMINIFGETRQCVLARELTKLYETVLTKPLGELLNLLNKDLNQQRGEMVILVKGAELNQIPLGDDRDNILAILVANLPLKQAVELAVKLSLGRKNELYQKALKLNQSN